MTRDNRKSNSEEENTDKALLESRPLSPQDLEAIRNQPINSLKTYLKNRLGLEDKDVQEIPQTELEAAADQLRLLDSTMNQANEMIQSLYHQLSTCHTILMCQPTLLTRHPNHRIADIALAGTFPMMVRVAKRLRKSGQRLGSEISFVVPTAEVTTSESLRKEEERKKKLRAITA